MPADFGYINARVRGLKANLLGSDFYNGALGASDFSGFLSSLSQTGYGKEIDEAQARYGSDLRAVDDAIGRNFFTAMRSLLNVADGLPERLLKVVLLRYDLNNLKTIARAKAQDGAGRDAEEIRAALLPAGELRPAILDTIAEAADLPAAAQAVALTRHPLSTAFTRAVGKFTSDGDLYALELALDRAYYQTIAKEAESSGFPKEFRDYVAAEIDATNIRTALKLRGAEGQDSDALYIKGGKTVTRTIFDALLSGDTQALNGTQYEEVGAAETLSAAEEVLRADLDRRARRLAMRNPLGVGVVLYYLRLKESESARLRLLARGKFYGVSRELLERELGDA